MRLASAAALLTLVLPPAALAQEEAPAAEPGKDHPLLKRYPGAVMTALDEKEFEEFAFTDGEKDGEVTTKKVEGAFFHADYTYPLKASCTQVIRNYENAFKSAGLAVHKGTATPAGAGGWGASDKWASAEGAIKGKGGKVYILVYCNEYDDAAANNIGSAYVEMPDFNTKEEFLAALKQGRIVGRRTLPYRSIWQRIIKIFGK